MFESSKPIMRELSLAEIHEVAGGDTSVEVPENDSSSSYIVPISFFIFFPPLVVPRGV